MVEGCWDGLIFKALSFHLFSFFVSWVFRVSKNGMWGKEKKKEKVYVYAFAHIKERSRWPSLIKEIFGETTHQPVFP